MKVELRQHEGINIANGQRSIVAGQDRVFVDDRAVGFLGHKPGSKLCLVERFSPWQVIEIINELERLTGRTNIDHSMAPKVPANLLKPRADDGITQDDID